MKLQLFIWFKDILSWTGLKLESMALYILKKISSEDDEGMTFLINWNHRKCERQTFSHLSFDVAFKFFT